MTFSIRSYFQRAFLPLIHLLRVCWSSSSVFVSLPLIVTCLARFSFPSFLVSSCLRVSVSVSLSCLRLCSARPLFLSSLFLLFVLEAFFFILRLHSQPKWTKYSFLFSRLSACCHVFTSICLYSFNFNYNFFRPHSQNVCAQTFTSHVKSHHDIILLPSRDSQTSPCELSDLLF